VKKAINAWVTCGGTSDETAGVAKAFAAAKHGAFTLIVDCPVNIKIGTDIARTIFIEDGTTVEFTGTGKFTVDNVQIPAFVIADSSNINLTNWNVEYDASMPVNESIGFENNGQFNSGKAGNAFNDVRLTQWLAANKAIVFDRSRGTVNSQWTGTTNACAVFFITGDSSYVNVSGMHLYVPANAGGDRFIPVAFALGMNFKRSQTVSALTPLTAQHVAIPQDLTFSNVTLDGTYMGWVGGLKDSVFENIASHRYGDLQDANGKNVGGLGKWFAPPHLFYLNYQLDGDAALFNTNIHIKNVVDSGIRIGKARDAGGGDSISGYANSLKLGCVDCTVDTYTSARPDGLMDVLTSDGLTISNVTATYNSAFLNNLYPGWRFPSATYKNVKFQNITLTDSAENTIDTGPIGNAGAVSNQSIVLSNVKVVLHNWVGEGAPFPAINGTGNDVSLNYLNQNTTSRQMKAQYEDVEVVLRATLATMKVGQTTELTWTAWQSSSCSGSGAWSGSFGMSGSRSVKMTTPGTYNFTLDCRNSGNSTSTTLSVVVSS
jgi:hypothetical protein